ncbi:putative non-specific serine/threonine protein kinase [Helianthus debilis subsp. tardiflorus]
MKFGWNLIKEIDRHFTSSKSVDDPAAGNFSSRIDIRGYPQVILRDGQEILFRSGPWNGLSFRGTPNLKPNQYYNFNFVLNEKEIYYQYNLIQTSVLTRLVLPLPPSGRPERLLWS